MNTTDLDIFWAINRDWSSPLLDYVMSAVSATEAWLPILLLLLLALALRGNQRLRLMLIAIVLALVLGDAVVGGSLKKVFGRVRPRDAMSGVHIRDLAPASPRTLALFLPPVTKISNVDKAPALGNSMPSNHTINLFATAFVVLSYSRIFGGAVLSLAALVAYSRVYVGAHWPSDIPPSIGFGLVCGWLAVMTVEQVKRYLTSRRGS